MPMLSRSRATPLEVAWGCPEQSRRAETRRYGAQVFFSPVMPHIHRSSALVA